MISVIDMPPPEESAWWRGKRGFEVGFFPCEYVEVISGGDNGNNSSNRSNNKSSTMPKGLNLAAATRGMKLTSKDLASTSAPAAVLNAGSDGDATTTGDEEEEDEDEIEEGSNDSGDNRSNGHQPSKPVLRKHGKLISFFR